MKMFGIPCSNVLPFDSSILLYNSHALPDAAYVLFTDFGALSDLAGNPMQRTDSDGMYSFTVDASAGGVSLVTSIPRDMGSLEKSNSTVVLFFSVPVEGKKDLDLFDCGVKCDASAEFLDTVVAVDSENTTNANSIVYVYLGNAVKYANKPIRTYKLKSHSAGFETAGGAGSDSFELVFTVDGTGFVATAALSPDVEASSESGLAFPVVFENVSPGTYSLCYCDDQLDKTLEDFGNGAYTYSLEDHLRLDPVPAASLLATGAFAGQASVGAHECAQKCKYGCVGSTCSCEDGEGAEADVLCLSTALCRSACDLVPGCAAFSASYTKDLCILSTTLTGTLDEEWETGVRSPGSACSHAHDFQTAVGVFTISSRVDVAVDYVVEPGSSSSIEITHAGAALMTASSGSLLSADRIMVIDDSGSCGISTPAPGAELPGNLTWPHFGPHSLFHDAPAESGSAAFEIHDSAPDLEYTTIAARYCAGANMDLKSFSVPMHGLLYPASYHQCYDKCSTKCTHAEDECFCDGYISGFDSPTSNAVCGDRDLCEYICDNTPDCVAVDMHAYLPRCFLNSACDNKEVSSDYGIRIKPLRRARRLAYDVGSSHTQLLRFEPITFTTGGTFKLCFCDSTLLGAGETCSKPADFAVQVGRVHASGVSCLLAEPKLRTVECESQLYGGMRCYGSGAPKIDIYEPLESYFGPASEPPTPEPVDTYCIYLPEEARASDPACQFP